MACIFSKATDTRICQFDRAEIHAALPGAGRLRLRSVDNDAKTSKEREPLEQTIEASPKGSNGGFGLTPKTKEADQIDS